MTTAYGGQADPAHEDWDALAVGYALSALEPGDQHRFAGHLTGCVRCQHSVAETEALGAAMGSSLDAPSLGAPSADLRSRVLAAAEQARPSRPSDTTVPEAIPAPRAAASPAAVTRRDVDAVVAERRGPRHGGRRPNGPSGPVGPGRPGSRRERTSGRRIMPWLVAATAAVVAAVLAVTSLTLAGDRNHQRSVAADRASIISSITRGGPAEIVPLKDSNGDQRATVVAQAGRVSVVTDSMPVNSASSIYVLWGLTSRDDAHPKALGTFDVGSTSLQSLSVANDLRGQFSSLTTFAISHEKGRSAPVSPTAVVALGSA